MHILITRPWLDKALRDHAAHTKEDAHTLVDRLLTGFFTADAPWAKRGNWETPLNWKQKP